MKTSLWAITLSQASEERLEDRVALIASNSKIVNGRS
jgi:hypothetical protein